MLLKPIRLWLHRWRLKKRLAEHEVDHESVSLEKAQHIGILFNATDPARNVAIQHFASKYKQIDKRVEVLGFIDGSHPEEALPFPHFSRKGISWLYIPKDPAVEHFMNQRFDILLNAYTDDFPVFDYITILSKAKMRMGLYNPDKTECYDVMVDSREEEPALPDLLNTFERYLKMIKTHG